MIEQIEKIKSDYTDKYVKVDPDRPELARFRDLVGQVKTVNMSGRALVEFLEYNVNIGWFDIDLDFLKVVDKPEPKPKTEKKAPAKKPAAKPAAKKAAEGEAKKLSPLEMARQQGAAGAGKPESKSTGDKPSSTADILAAARGGAAPAKAKSAAGDAKAKPKAAPAKTAGGKMSTADILAAARGGAAPPEAEEPEAEEPEVEAPEEAAAESPPEVDPTPAAPATPGKVDKSSMSVDEMIAYCREHDAS